MDREQEELQFLGVLGIYHEAYKILTTCRKIFTQITVALILPLSFVFLAHIQISDFIFAKIGRNEEALDTTRMGSARRDQILHQLSSERASYLVFKAAYLVLVLILNLLSTSAVVYTIACVYTAKEITFRRVLSVVPKVWKRLMVTFFWAFIVLLAYNTLAVLLMFFLIVLIGPNAAGFALVFLILAFHFVGLVYISIVWHLASVVSVLEDVYGFAAMQKSKLLIKGKALTASAIFLKINAAEMAVHVAFAVLVVYGELGAGGEGGVRAPLPGLAVGAYPAGAASADRHLLRLQVVPPREHRQVMLGGSSGGVPRRVCSPHWKISANGGDVCLISIPA